MLLLVFNFWLASNDLEKKHVANWDFVDNISLNPVTFTHIFVAPTSCGGWWILCTKLSSCYKRVMSTQIKSFNNVPRIKYIRFMGCRVSYCFIHFSCFRRHTHFLRVSFPRLLWGVTTAIYLKIYRLTFRAITKAQVANKMLITGGMKSFSCDENGEQKKKNRMERNERSRSRSIQPRRFLSTPINSNAMLFIGINIVRTSFQHPRSQTTTKTKSSNQTKESTHYLFCSCFVSGFSIIFWQISDDKTLVW